MGVIADIVGGGGLMFLLNTTSQEKNECKILTTSRQLGGLPPSTRTSHRVLFEQLLELFNHIVDGVERRGDVEEYLLRVRCVLAPYLIPCVVEQCLGCVKQLDGLCDFLFHTSRFMPFYL